MHLLAIYCYISERVPDARSDIEKELMELLMSASANMELLNRPSIANNLIREASRLLKGVIEPALPYIIPIEDAISDDIPRKIVEYLGREDLSDIDIELKEQLDLNHSKEIEEMVKHALSTPVKFSDLFHIVKTSEERLQDTMSRERRELRGEFENFKNELRREVEDYKKQLQDTFDEKEQQLHQKLQERQSYCDEIERKLQQQTELLERAHQERSDQNTVRDEPLKKPNCKKQNCKLKLIYLACVLGGAVMGAIVGGGVGACVGGKMGACVAAAGVGVGAVVGASYGVGYVTYDHEKQE